MGHKAHISSMMNMRFEAMKLSMEVFWATHNDIMEYELTGQLREVDARKLHDESYVFEMFTILDSTEDAFQYRPLPGY